MTVIHFTNSTMKIMKTNREKFLALVSEYDTYTEEKHNWRIANRQWLWASQDIALDIMDKLDDLGWTLQTTSGVFCISYHTGLQTVTSPN